MNDRVCNDCDGLLDLAPRDLDVPDCGSEWDADLMCVLCGAALSLGGLLLGEALARELDDRVA